MIVRDSGNDFLLIRQHDHALLAGQWVKHIGNVSFGSPLPLRPFEIAVSQHDFGWQKADEMPTVFHGKPRHVFTLPPLISPQTWQDSIDHTVAADAYAGLLASLHCMGLATVVADQIEKNSNNGREEFFRLNQFLHRQIEIQEQLRLKIGLRIDQPLRRGLAEPGRSDDEDLLRANFFLMQFLDRLSLNVCFDRLNLDRLDPVYPSPGSKSISIRFERTSENCIRANPWPFDQAVIESRLAVRRIPRRQYESDADLRATVAAAPNESISVWITQ